MNEEESFPKPIVPQQIGPYRIRGDVGEGAFSVVRLASKGTDYYACKIVPRNRILSEDLMDRFETEIRVFQQMHHPGIVQLVDLVSDQNNFYVFMEFCPNGELFQYIVERGKLPEDEAKPLIRQLLDTLKYVHSMGVSHRDLKPENLLLDKDGFIKLSDFGLSRFCGENNLVETPCGSPCYASPECLSGEAYNGITTDVWSLGVIVYAMLTGQLPWTKRNQAQLFNQIKRGQYTVPSFLSDDCQNFIKGLMDVNIETRLTIDEAINHPFMKDTPLIQPPSSGVSCTDVSLRQVDLFFDGPSPSVVFDINTNEPKSARMNSFSVTVQLLSRKGLPLLRGTKSFSKSGAEGTNQPQPIPQPTRPIVRVQRQISQAKPHVQRKERLMSSVITRPRLPAGSKLY